MKFKDITEQKFGRLTAKTRLGSNSSGASYWQCECDCGNTVSVTIDRLNGGNTKSCGCLKREIASLTTKKRNQENRNLKYGALIHGESRRTKLYSVWNAMKDRCSNPNNIAYKYYGGRGIKVCDEWIKYIPFRDWSLANGYKEGLWIDRENNDGNYEPENCRWVTPMINASNRRQRSKRKAK